MRYFYALLLGVTFISFSAPSYAAFTSLQERQEELTERKELRLKQQEDTTNILGVMKENNILLKGILLEMRKQTELLDTISTEQKNQGVDISKQAGFIKNIIKKQYIK